MFRPVLAGMWTHRDIVEGVYTLEDLMDINEVLDLKEENAQRARAYSENQRSR